MDPSLIPFLNPRGVVVIGASTSPEKLGYGIARNLIASKYPGAIHFVSQKQGSLFDHPLYTDLADVPDPADLAVIVVPSLAMPDALHACGQRGIRAAILISAGFREAGPEGAALEAECAKIASDLGIRLLGPNCIGTLDTHLPLDTTFLQTPMPESGAIGFISHSGAFCAAILDWSRRQGLGFSQIVSLGNQVDVNETDMLPVLAEDEKTQALVLYMEGVSDGRKFVDTAIGVAEKKPIIALKAGRSAAGQKAAASHTGAMVGSEVAFDAAFAKAGVLRAASTEQMFDWARAFGPGRLPGGRNVAVLTDAGGPGVIATDALETNNLSLAELSNTTLGTLTERLPAAASVHNPVDMLASASPQDYADCLRLLLDDPHVDSVLTILPPPPMFSAESVAQAIIPVIAASAKPVVIALLGSIAVDKAEAAFKSSNIPIYAFPERAASALGALARRAEWLKAQHHRSEPGPSAPSQAVTSGTVMTAAELVASYGISTAQIQLAESAEEAVSIAAGFGYPVALKIASPQLSHKSDVGGVLLNIQSADGVQRGYAQVIARIRERVPDALIQGVYVQSQVPEGQEVILGALRDPNFGPLVMFGSGGVEAEGLKDITFALAPLTIEEADELIQRTWAGRKLDGFRDIPAADRSAVREALMQFSCLASAHPEIREIEINPLRVLAKGALALDVRMVL